MRANGVTVQEIEQPVPVSASEALATKRSHSDDDHAEAETEAVSVPEVILPQPPGMGASQVCTTPMHIEHGQYATISHRSTLDSYCATLVLLAA